MQLPKMKKLSSGTWRMQLQVDGERYSITDRDPKVVKQKAKEIIGGHEKEKRSPLTVGKALDKYIKAKEINLSPSTIRCYQGYRREYLQAIMDVNLNFLTQENVDDAILIDLKRGVGPKTIKNAHGLLTAMLKKYRPKFHLTTELPKIEHEEVQIPTEEELTKIWTEVFSGKYKRNVQLAITLAAWLGLRMSEILGLRFSDLEGEHLNISHALVRSSTGDVLKGPKTKAGKRRIRVPENILAMINEIPRDGEYIINCHRSTINKHFREICERAGVPYFRVHDLRHFAASEALSLNIPNKYQMKRMGHSTDYMLQRVYQHVMRDKEDQFFDPYDEQMSKIFKNAHAASHEKIKTL